MKSQRHLCRWLHAKGLFISQKENIYSRHFHLLPHNAVVILVNRYLDLLSNAVLRICVDVARSLLNTFDLAL